MPYYTGPAYLAPTGSTGNNTHTSVPVADNAESFAVEFIVEAAGGTPTVTWKVQGSVDPPEVSDANSGWFDLFYVTDATDTGAASTRTATAVGKQVEWPDLVQVRVYRKIRLVTSANTNITYRGELYQLDRSS